MRKLVTLREVAEIVSIPGADAIEVAVVDGWSCVVKKGEFKAGERAVYFEIDSILPYGDERFAFLMSRSCKMQPTEDGGLLEGHRLRTIKLRGQVSQGLLIPVPQDWKEIVGGSRITGTDENGKLIIEQHNEISFTALHSEGPDYIYHFNADDDLSEIFGVKKYEKPIPAQLAGMCAGNYPSWLPKTDQDRIQNCFNKAPVGIYHVEEKFEGSSMTIYHDGEKLGVTSRNLDLKLDQEGNAFVDMAKASGIFDALEDQADIGTTRVAIRGELIGPGIQGNIYNLSKPKFMIFDVFIDGNYLDPTERARYLEEMVKPYIKGNVEFVQTLFTLEKDDTDPKEQFANFYSRATGKSVLADTLREGIVFKSGGDNVFSFKAISPEYLLGEKE